jgi:hypothetical protein
MHTLQEKKIIAEFDPEKKLDDRQKTGSSTLDDALRTSHTCALSVDMEVFPRIVASSLLP